MAVDHAQRVLGWQESLARDEMPPSWMWPLEWELEAWFADVEHRRSERFGGRPDNDDEGGPMIQNELAAAMRARRKAS